MSGRTLSLRAGTVAFPAYIPVTTFGAKHPLDDLVRPYLPRLAPAVMVSYHYARQMDTRPGLPLFVDSGGFASLFSNARVVGSKGLGILELRKEQAVERLSPHDVLDLQEQIADVAFTLDFPIPPGLPKRDASRRQKLTIANALWAIQNRQRKDLALYGCVQAWDDASARACARAYAGAGFDGVAIGGLVPRLKDLKTVLKIVDAVRTEVSELPLHVFGVGNPDTVERLFRAGVDSVDSSSYIRLAADGRLWSHPDYRAANPSPTDRLHLALCNLAAATGRTLPLSASGFVFTTHALTSNGTRSKVRHSFRTSA
jgi:tRNA-guanine family transglycosylase